MKRSRPKQHVRRIKTKKGIKKVLVNKGRRAKPRRTVRKREEQKTLFPTEQKPYEYTPRQVSWVQGIINNKMESNRGLAWEASKIKRKQDTEITMRGQQVLGEKLSDIKRKVADNNNSIERLMKKYELGKYRR